jgi:hypothetical protein
MHCLYLTWEKFALFTGFIFQFPSSVSPLQCKLFQTPQQQQRQIFENDVRRQTVSFPLPLRVAESHRLPAAKPA